MFCQQQNQLIKVYGVVYLITNRINSKIYVGQTIQGINERLSQHLLAAVKSPTTRALTNAIKKYGKDSFKIEVLSSAYSQNHLDFLERLFIFKFKAYPTNLGFGYNMTPGGYGGGHCKPHTLETKDKISRLTKGRRCSPEVKKVLSNIFKGRKCTWGDKVSTSLKAKNLTSAMKGKTRSITVKKNMAAGCLVRSTPKYRLLLSYVNTHRSVLKGGFYGS